MGTLTYSSTSGAQPVVIVTGGNNYSLWFNSTNLSSDATPATFNIASGLTTFLPAAGFTNTNVPTNVGAGNLVLYGPSSVTSALTTTINGTTPIAAIVNTVNQQYGGNTLSLSTGATLQINPVASLTSNLVSSAGYTTGGGLAGHYFVYANGNTPFTSVFAGGSQGEAVVNGVTSGVWVGTNTAALINQPVNAFSGTSSGINEVFTGLLNITTAGTYTFGTNSDDESGIDVDGNYLHRSDNTGTGNGVTAGGFSATQSMFLTAGQHVITVRYNQGGGNLGNETAYEGPDTAINGSQLWQNIPASALAYANGTGAPTAVNNYLNAAQISNAVTVPSGASVTLDLNGSDFNATLSSLTLAGGSTLTVNNGAPGNEVGVGVIGVTGLTTISASGVTISPNTGALALLGGVSDGGNGLTKTGQATLMLGTSSSFSGALAINGGYVQTLGNNALTSGAITVGNANISTVAGFLLSATTTQTVTSTAGLFAGEGVSATGGTGSIPAGDYITAINGPTTYTLNVASTAGTPTTVTYYSGAAIDLDGTSQSGGPITLTGNGPTPSNQAAAYAAALYNSSTVAASASNNITIGPRINGLAVAIGGYGPITLSGTLSDTGNGWSKVGYSTLTLSGTNSGLTGTFDVASGVLQAGSANPFGNTALALTSTGTASDTNASSSVTGATTSGLYVGEGVTGLGVSAGTFITAITGPTTFTMSQNASSTNANATFTYYQDNIASGATLDLNGQTISTARSFFVSGAGNVGLPTVNTLGAIINSSATAAASFNGALTMNANSSIGSSVLAVNTATYGLSQGQFGASALNGSFTSEVLTPQAGDITLSGIVSGGAFTLTKTGQDTVFLTATSTLNVSGTPDPINLGQVVLQGSATVAGATAFSIFSGGTLTLDNSGTYVPSRLGTHSLTFSAGDLNMIGNSGANAVETLTNPVTFSNSGNIVTLLPSTAENLQFTGGSLVNTAGATELFRGTNLGANTSASNAAGAANLLFTTNPTFIGSASTSGATIGILPYALADTSNTGSGVAFATYLAANGIQALTASSSYYVTTITAGDNVILSTTASLATVGTTNINSLTLTGANLTVGSGNTLQVASGGILATTSQSIIGGTVSTVGTNTVYLHTLGSGTALTLNSPITDSTGGLAKADSGTAVLGAQELYTGNTFVNGGTLQLNGGNQTLFVPLTTGGTPGNVNSAITSQLLQVNLGGTLDLNGNNQAVAEFSSAGALPNTGGTVTNSSGAASTFAMFLNANLTFAGSLTGNLNFLRTGDDTFTVESASSYTGTTTIEGGATSLIDQGAFAGTTGITINRSALIWNDTGVQAVANRIPASAPITMNGGALTYNARAGTQGAIQIGNVTLNSGASEFVLNASSGSANLTIGTGTGAALTRVVGGTVNFNSGPGIGDINHVYLAGTAPTQTGGIIGGWATMFQADPIDSLVVEPGFAVNTTNGLQSLNFNLTTIATGSVPTGANARVNANVTLPGGGVTLNTVSMINAATTTISFTNPTDTLTVTTGGILTGLDNNAKLIGASAGSGNLTAGSGQQELFIHDGANTLTVNSNIIDNGVTGGLNVVLDSMSQTGNAPTIVLAGANTNAGTTYVNGVTVNLSTPGANGSSVVAINGNLVLSGGNNNGTDSLAIGNGTTTLSANNEIAFTSNVTLNGGSELNLNSFNNTIASLAFTNDGGGNGGGTANGPAVLTGLGALTVAGNITVTNSSSGFDVPVINGFLTLSSATPTISVAANTALAQQMGLVINAPITLTAASSTPLIVTGGGVLAIGGDNSFTNTVNVTGGTTLAFSGTGANGSTGARINAQINLAAGTTLDLRANFEEIGALSGSGTLTSYGVTAATLTTGIDSIASATPDNTSFSGAITNPFVQGLLSLTKIGTGTMTLTGSNLGTGLLSPNLGTLIVNGGGVTVSGTSGVVGFGTYTLNVAGTLTLDNSTNEFNNRLGGPFDLTSPTVTNATTARTFNFNGGNLTITGNSGIAVSEGLGGISADSGGTITLNAAGTAGVNLTIQSLLNVAAGGNNALLIRGDSLGTAAGSGIATVKFNTAPTLLGGGGGNGTVTKSIRPDILVDTSDTGTGTSFLTIDGTNGLGLVRALAASEMSSITATTSGGANNTNYVASLITWTGSASATGLPGNITYSSLTLQSGGGVNLDILTNNPWGANGGLLTITPANAEGVLALAGNTGITAGNYGAASGNNIFQVPLGSSLTMNTALVVNSGFGKSGGGTMILNQPYADGGSGTGTVSINGGTLRLSAGQNTIFVRPTVTTPALTTLNLDNGTLDLNGNSQVVGTLSTPNTSPYAGGTAANPNAVINNSAAAPVNFFTNNGTATFSGVIENTGGALSFYKTGANTLTLTSPSTYTGATILQGGTTSLKDYGALSGTSAITISYAGLTIDNTGLVDLTNRIPAAAPLTLNGGTFTVSPGQSIASENIGAATLNQGNNTFAVNQYNANSQTGSFTLTLANLIQQNNAVVNFTNGSGTMGATGASPHVFLTQVNGSAFSSSSLVNGIIGGWATVNGSDFASYVNASGVGAVGTTGYPAYSADALTAGVAADNINVTATVTDTGSRTINSLAIRNPNNATTVTLAAGELLTIGTGGLLINDAQNKGVTITGGQITAGTTSAAATLYLDSAQNSNINVNSQIVNNSNGGAVTFVRSSNSGSAVTVAMAPTVSNTYTGGTIVNGGTLTLNAGPGITVLPGNLTLQGNGTVTETTNAQQISTTSNVTINGSGVLNLFGANTLASLTFGDNGGSATPSVNVGTSTTLALSGNITSQNDNIAATPTITFTTAGTLNFTGASPTITTSGLSPDDLIISTAITSTGTITKAGAGSLILPNANAAVLNWNLSAGSLILGSATSLGAAGSTLTISGPGTLFTGTASGTALALTVATPVTFSSGGSLTFGGQQSGINLTLSGQINLGGATSPVAFNVAGQAMVSTITGQIVNGTGGITKGGPGALALTPTTANTFSGPLAITGGLLTLGNANALPSSIDPDTTVAAGAELNINALATSLGSLSGGGLVTNSGAAAALTVGDSTNATFNGALVAATAANLSLVKIGSDTQQLTNAASNYAGGTTVNAGSLMLAGSNTVDATGTGAFVVNSGGNVSGSGLLPTLTLNSGSSASIPLLGGPTSPSIVVSGATGLTISPNITINATGTPVAGTYGLIGYGNTSALTAVQFADFELGTTPGGSFYYVLSNDTANKSIDLTVQTISTNLLTWAGNVSQTWDTVSNNWSGSATVYSDGSQVTFNDSANTVLTESTNLTITGGNVQPQSLRVNNSAVNYSIGNNIVGTLAGGLTKSGTGNLTLTGANTFSGATALNGGTLEAAVSATASGLGSSPITVAGGTTLRFDPTASIASVGLTARNFNYGGAAVNDLVSTLNLNLTATQIQNVMATGGVSLNNPPGNTDVAFVTGGQLTNFGTQFLGKINIVTSGNYAFFLNSDDGSRLFIDGQYVANEDGGRGVGGTAAGTINLTAGLHDLLIQYNQAGGNDGITLQYQGPGAAAVVTVPSTSVYVAENSSLAAANNLEQAGNNVTLTGNATINLSGTNFVGVQLGGLSISNGQTLMVSGLAASRLQAAYTNLTGGGTITLNDAPDVDLGIVSDGGTAVTLVKQGAGRLVFDNSPPTTGGVNPSSLVAGSNINIQGGKVVLSAAASNGTAAGADPIGSASLTLNGGTLLLDSQGGSQGNQSGNVTYNNAVSLSQNGTIQVQPDGGGSQNSVVITLGSATNGISLGNKMLTIDAFGGTRNGNPGNGANGNGAQLTVAGAITGTNGAVTIQSTQFNAGQYGVPGSVVYSAANTYSGATVLNGVYAATASNQGVAVPLTLTLSGAGTAVSTSSITLNSAQLTLDDSGTNTQNRLGASTGAAVPVTSNGGVLLFKANATASTASTENIGALTFGAGFNVVTATNTSTGAASTLAANSLVRNNNATIAYTASVLGTAATASDNITYATAPTLYGGGGAAGSPTINILPYAIGEAGTNNWGLVTYDASGTTGFGIRTLNTSTEYVTSAANAAATTNNVRDVSPTTITAGTFNSYTLDNQTAAALGVTGAAVALGGNTGYGTLLFANNNATASTTTITGGSFAFGANEGLIFLSSSSSAAALSAVTLSASTSLSGTGGLTVSGFGTLTLQMASNPGLVGGTLTVNGTELQIAAAGTLGTLATIQLGGGASSFTGNGGNYGGGFIQFNAGGITLTQNVTLEPGAFGGFDTGSNSGGVSGNITGSGNLVKINGNTLTLSGTGNTYSGATYVYGGALSAGTGNLPTGGAIFNQANLTFTGASGAFSGPISGIGSVTITPTAGQTITLSGANSYTGGTTISAGTSGNVNTLAGTAASSIQGAITTNNFTAVNFTDSNSLANTFQGTISGTGAVNFNLGGSTSVVLNGPNTYSGATGVNSGTLALQNSPSVTQISTLGATAVTVTSGATLAPQVASSTVTSVTIGSGTAGSLTLNSGSALDMRDGAITTLNIAGSSSGTNLTIGSAGSPPVQLYFDLGGLSSQNDTINVAGFVTTGASGGTINVNVLSSDTSLTPGNYTLIHDNNSAALSGLSLASNTVYLDGNRYTLGLTENTNSVVLTVTGNNQNPIYWTGGLSGAAGSAWNSISGSGPTATTNWATDHTGATNSNTLPGPSASGYSDVYETADSAANLAQTLGQNFTINSLTFTGSGTSASGGVTIASGGSGGNSLTINAAAGTGIMDLNGTGATTISANMVLGGNQTWTNASANSLTISGQISGASSLSTAGSGTIVLTGSNLFSGGANINAGALLVNNTSGSGLGTGAVTVQTGGSLGGGGIIGMATSPVNVSLVSSGSGSGNNCHLAPGYGLTGTNVATLTINGTLSLASSSILDYRLGNTTTVGLTANDLTTVSGQLTLGSSGTVNINAVSGSLALGTYTLISAGSISDPSGIAGWSVGSNNDSLSAGRVYLVGIIGSNLDLTITTPLAWTGHPGGNGVGAGLDVWDSAGNPAAGGPFANFASGSPAAATTYSDGSAVTFGDSNSIPGDGLFAPDGTVNIVAAGVSPFTVTFGNNAVTYTVGSSGSVGIAGSTGILINGGGTVIFTSQNTYTGLTTVTNNSTLSVSADKQLGGTGGTPPNVVLTGGTLQATGATSWSLNAARNVLLGNSSSPGTISVAANTTLTIPGQLQDNSSGGTLRVAGTGTLVLNGSNSYSGATTINSGATLQIGDGVVTTNSLPAAAGNTVSDNGKLVFNIANAGGSASAINLLNTIGGSGSLTQNGQALGTLVLKPTASNTYGGTVVANGTLQLGLDGSGNPLTGDGINPLPVNTAVSFGVIGTGTTAILDLNGNNAQVSALNVVGPSSSTAYQIINSNDVNSFSLPQETLSTLTFNGGSGTSNFSGVFTESTTIGGGGQIALSVTSGTLILSAANPTSSGNGYSGGTTISGGTLQVTNSSGSATGSGNVLVNNANGGGTLMGGGAAGGIIALGSGNAVTIANGGTIVGGTVSAPLTISGGNGLALQAGSISQFTPTATGTTNPLISVTTLAESGSNALVKITNGPSLGAGTYDLIGFTSGPATSDPATNFAFVGGQTFASGDTARLVLTINQLDLVITGSSTDTTASLLATPTAPVIHVPGGPGSSSSVITLTLSNTGGGSADSINYNGQDLTISGTNPGGLSGSLGSRSNLPLPSGNLAAGNSVTGTATFSSVAGNVGQFTVSPTIGTMTDHTSGHTITPTTGNSIVNVNYYAQPALSLDKGTAGSGSPSGAVVLGVLYLNVTPGSGSSAGVTLTNTTLDPTFQDNLGGSFTSSTTTGVSTSFNTINPIPSTPGSNSQATVATVSYTAGAASAPGSYGSFTLTPTSINTSSTTTLSGVPFTVQLVSTQQKGLQAYTGGQPPFGAGSSYVATWSVQSNSGATGGSANSYGGLLSGASGTDGANSASVPGGGYGPFLHSTTQTASGNVGGGAPLYAQILAGYNSGTYTGNNTAAVSMSWRSRFADESSPLEPGGAPSSPPLPYVGSYLVSNVLNLSGLGTSNAANQSAAYSSSANTAYFGNSSVTEHETDPFAQQMNYDANLLSDEKGQAKKGTIYVGWLAPAGAPATSSSLLQSLTKPEWLNAVTGDFDSSGHQTGVAANGRDAVANFNNLLGGGSFADFVAFLDSTNPNGDFSSNPTVGTLTAAQLSDILGSWGVDPTNHDAWAVINHNSQFAVVPEPSTLALAALGLLGLAGYGVRRRRTK